MDGAFALYEAWVRLQHGDIDTALVYAFGQASLVTSIGSCRCSSTRIGRRHSGSMRRRSPGSSERCRASPSCSTCSLRDGAAAVILAAGDRAQALREQPAWIRGIDHRIDVSELSQRAIAELSSAAACAQALNLGDVEVERAELHYSFEHQLPMLRRAIGLPVDVPVNLGATSRFDTYMVSGLLRWVKPQAAIWRGEAVSTGARQRRSRYAAEPALSSRGTP